MKHTNDMQSYFARQGYSQDMFDKALTKVQTRTREEILYGDRPTPEMEAPPIPLITTYGCGMPNVTKIMHKHWNVLLSSPIVKEIMPTKPTVAYRRPKNIRDDIVRAAISYPTQETQSQPKGRRCTKYNCKTCKSLKKQDVFKCPNTGEIIHLPKEMHCQMTNVVYLLYCHEHKSQYVGETKRAFNTRLTEHLADIKHQRDKPVSNHYKNKSHYKKEPDFHILEHLTGDPEKSQHKRRQKERNWIYNLRSHTPYGMNTMGK